MNPLHDETFLRIPIPFFPDYSLWEGMLNGRQVLGVQMILCGVLILAFLGLNLALDRWELSRRRYRPKACSGENQ